MIVVVGANGVAAWVVRTWMGRPRQLVCLNDQFIAEFPFPGPTVPRRMLVDMLQHSEALNGRTLSVGTVAELT
jgi:hypothetical protein